MKTKMKLMALAMMLAIMTSCNISEEPKKPSDSTSLQGSTQKPSWVVGEDYDYSSGMTAIVKVDLLQTYPSAVDGEGIAIDDNIIDKEDLLAAFIDDTCVGVQSPIDGLFFLYIVNFNTSQDTKTISLRYYSAKLQNMFEAKDVFVFKNNDNKGTISEPFKPEFTLLQ